MLRKFTTLCLVLFVLGTLALTVQPVQAHDPLQDAGQSGTTLTATKTATGHIERTFKWTIAKSVTPVTWNLFQGDSGTSQYTITVTKDAGTDVSYVSGEICVTNGGAVATQNLKIVDEVQYKVGSGQFQTLTTFTIDLDGFAVLEPGASHCYPYKISFTPVPGATYRNVAHVTITNHAGHIPVSQNCPGPDLCPFGPDSKADFSLPSSPDVLINDVVNVTDTNGSSWQFNASGSQTYDKTFTCNTDKGTHNNTATINETGQSASASVTVNCYALNVSKTANTTYTRTFAWDIKKSVTPTSLDLFRGTNGSTTYTVSWTKDSGTDSDWAVNGKITIQNPAPISARINYLNDVVSTGIKAVVDCGAGVAFPYDLAASATLTCTYTAGLPNADPRTNTATATIQNYAYSSSLQKNASGTTDFSGTANVTFGDPTKLVNDQVTINDTVQGQLATPNASGSTSYQRTFACDKDGGGGGTYPNTASIKETGASASASVTVTCYGLTVTKTAQTSFTRTFAWTIQKSVTPAQWDLFKGDSGTSQYTVAWTKDSGTDSSFVVNGAITITNSHPSQAANLSSVIDSFEGANASVNCPSLVVPANNGQLTCTYSITVGSKTNGTNTATAALFGVDYQGTAPVTFGAPTTLIHDEITIKDTFKGALGTFKAGGSTTYDRTFTCDADKGDKPNTASITFTDDQSAGPSADATVKVNCYALDVTKTAKTTFTRTYKWTIQKSADQSKLDPLALNESFPVNYSVKADATYTDSAWAVSGVITVKNPAPKPALINTLTDVVSPDIKAAVDKNSCQVDGQPDVHLPDAALSLPAGSTVTCNYSVPLPDAAARTNTATATLQNFAYSYNNPAGTAKANTTTDFSGTADVKFDKPTTEVDKCIHITDSLQGDLGTVCYGTNTLPVTITYTRNVGPYTTCGQYTVSNTATFTTSDTNTTGSSTWVIPVNVPCKGCSLTIGYWKTHAGFGPQADMVSPLLPISLGSGGGKTVIVDTAALAVQLLSFNGSNNVFDASNGINKLYAQLLGAKLNMANGADGSAIASTIAAADVFLATHNSLDWASLSKADKNKVLGWMTTLDKYNNGLIGPGHCVQ